MRIISLGSFVMQLPLMQTTYAQIYAPIINQHYSKNLHDYLVFQRFTCIKPKLHSL